MLGVTVDQFMGLFGGEARVRRRRADRDLDELRTAVEGGMDFRDAWGAQMAKHRSRPKVGNPDPDQTGPATPSLDGDSPDLIFQFSQTPSPCTIDPLAGRTELTGETKLNDFQEFINPLTGRPGGLAGLFEPKESAARRRDAYDIRDELVQLPGRPSLLEYYNALVEAAERGTSDRRNRSSTSQPPQPIMDGCVDGFRCPVRYCDYSHWDELRLAKHMLDHFHDQRLLTDPERWEAYLESEKRRAVLPNLPRPSNAGLPTADVLEEEEELASSTRANGPSEPRKRFDSLWNEDPVDIYKHWDRYIGNGKYRHAKEADPQWLAERLFEELQRSDNLWYDGRVGEYLGDHPYVTMHPEVKALLQAKVNAAAHAAREALKASQVTFVDASGTTVQKGFNDPKSLPQAFMSRVDFTKPVPDYPHAAPLDGEPASISRCRSKDVINYTEPSYAQTPTDELYSLSVQLGKQTAARDIRVTNAQTRREFQQRRKQRIVEQALKQFNKRPGPVQRTKSDHTHVRFDPKVQIAGPSSHRDTDPPSDIMIARPDADTAIISIDEREFHAARRQRYVSLGQEISPSEAVPGTISPVRFMQHRNEKRVSFASFDESITHDKEEEDEEDEEVGSPLRRSPRELNLLALAKAAESPNSAKTDEIEQARHHASYTRKGKGIDARYFARRPTSVVSTESHASDTTIVAPPTQRSNSNSAPRISSPRAAETTSHHNNVTMWSGCHKLIPSHALN